MSSRISDELKSWIGREALTRRPRNSVVRPSAISRSPRRPQSLYHDEALAKGSRHGGIVAPPTLVCETNQIFQNGRPMQTATSVKLGLPLSACAFHPWRQRV